MNRRTVLMRLAILPCLGWLNLSAQGEPVPVGASRFVFTEPGHPDLPVWTYRPSQHGPDDPVLVVMHGTRRNADEYRDAWIDSAERLGVLLLAPEFKKSEYPTGWGYQQIGVLDAADALRHPDEWAPQRIEALFDEVRRRNDLRTNRYYFYGHSAGGQFVHRAILTMPKMRVALALPANSGWYTLPTRELPFPEGLGRTPVTPEWLRESLTTPVVVMLGDADTDTSHRHLPRGPAAERQGPHRFARGQHFYTEAERAASRLGCELAWRVEVAPGVPHSNSEMAPFAERVIADHLSRSSRHQSP